MTILCATVALEGCARLGYYAHLGRGGLALVTGGKRVERLLGDPDTPAELESRLRFASGLLEFAATELRLPVGRKYRKYLDLGRPYVVWTVVATPEFSLEPETWCFPIAGCVGYQGFFSPDRADRFAGRLRRRGLDVSVGGVRAFSTLGWLGDPLLNTFLFDDDRRLAGLLFHELAHGLLYVRDDTAFNESFATAVERTGVGLWLRAQRSADVDSELAGYRRSLDELDDDYVRIERLRARLEALYSGAPAALETAELRARKTDLFAGFQRELAASDPERRSALAGWIGRDLNNADLASVGFYSEQLASFERLRQAVGEDLERFYAAARCLARLAADERSRRMATGAWGDCILDRP